MKHNNFYRICKTNPRKQVLHISKYFYFEYGSASKGTKGPIKSAIFQAGIIETAK